jgi:hypothetical protein
MTGLLTNVSDPEFITYIVTSFHQHFSYKRIFQQEMLSFHGGVDSSQDLLGCDPEDGGSIAFHNIGILHHYMASQPRRQLEKILLFPYIKCLQ